jgi:sigma-B regulation protein RsbU (phosphoserine phosphatase)
MRRLSPFAVLPLVVLLLAAVGPCAIAQTPAQVQHVQDPRNYNATRTGEVVDLGPLWLFQQGDNPAWAAKDFDDSQWPTVTTRKGFASQGYPDVNQFWYRVHMRVRPDSGPLVLGITTFYGSYEIFVNGVRIGGEGKMSGRGEVRFGRLILFGIPKEAVRSGELVVALHGAVGAYAYASESFYEGVTATSGRIMIGGPVALAPLTFESYMRGVLIDWIFLVLVSFVVFIVLALYRALPDQKEYLVIALCGGFQLLEVCSSLLTARLRLMSSGLVHGIAIFADAAFLVLQFEVVLRLVGIRPARWIRALQGVLILSALLTELRFAGVVSLFIHRVLESPALIVLYIAVPIYLYREMRRGNPDAPVLFAFQIVWSTIELLYQTSYFLYKAHLVSSPAALAPALVVGQYDFFAYDIATLYFWVTLLVIIVLRTVRLAREKAEITAEVEAARTVQQVLIPDFLPQIPGLRVETAYLPAQQVGGDFFQVLPIADGAAFIVVGDVSGKGLKAAMTVSLIVGALRMYAESCTSPGELLAGINRRLHGRHAGYATCLVLKITPAGDVTIANAGHPNPYLDGAEVSTDSNFPLGLTLDVKYAETRLHIDPAQSLTLVTDGVVEATAATTRELFGFDRTQAISRHAANAIAEAAHAFGIGAPQSDDITVLTVARTAA